MKNTIFSFMGADYKISYEGDKKAAIKNFESLIMSAKSDSDIFSDFLRYGKNQSKYYAKKHDYDIDTGACFIASGMIERYYKYLSDFDDVNANTRLSAFSHVYGCIYASLAQLNYSKCGVYSRSHWSTDNTEYLPNAGAIFHDAQITRKPDLKGGKMIDVFDLLEQWENRQAKTESKMAKYAVLADAVKLADNSRTYMTQWEKSCADKNANSANGAYSIRIGDYIATMKDATYKTAESEAIDRDNINSLYFIVSDIKKEKSFNRVADILHSGVKNRADEKALERFRARHNLKNISADDLRAVFEITLA